MKKGLSAVLLVLTMAVCAVAFLACAPGVSGESDLYGSFFTEEYGRCITLGADNLAVVEYGSSSENYYARYDLMNSRIEFRLNDYWGDVVYTVVIKDADTLELQNIYDAVKTDEDGKVITDANGNPVSEQVVGDPIVFVRDSYYNPQPES